MARDPHAVHAVLADLLGNAHERWRFTADPAGYARQRLDGRTERGVIASVPPRLLNVAATQQDLKRVLGRPPAAGGGAGGTGPAPAPAPAARSQSDRRTVPAFGPGPRTATAPATSSRPRPLVGLGHWPDLHARLGGGPHAPEVWELKAEALQQAGGDAGGEGDGGLFALAAAGPVTVHAVGLSVASTRHDIAAQPVEAHGAILRALGVDELSDHLCFVRAGGRALAHFAPIWRIAETLDAVAANVDRLQDRLGARLVLENIAPAFDLPGELGVCEFLSELATRTGCGVLLDLTNLSLSAANGQCDVAAELARLDRAAVTGVHLAGGEEVDGVFVDAHGFPLAEADLALLAEVLPTLPNCRTVVVERDTRRKALEVASDLARCRAVVSAVWAAPPGCGCG